MVKLLDENEKYLKLLRVAYSCHWAELVRGVTEKKILRIFNLLISHKGTLWRDLPKLKMETGTIGRSFL